MDFLHLMEDEIFDSAYFEQFIWEVKIHGKTGNLRIIVHSEHFKNKSTVVSEKYSLKSI